MPTSGLNTAKTPLRVLIIEDYEEDALLLQRYLSRAGYAVDSRRVQTAQELQNALRHGGDWELVIADYTLPSFGARDALKLIQKSGLDLPFIIVSGTIDEVSAVNAMRAGAHDYVLKGHLERLLPAIERELADASRRRERLRTESELRLAQLRFSATFNQAAVGMAHTAPDGRFLLINQRLADLLGAPIEKLLQLNLADFLLPSERDLDASLLHELLHGKRSGYRVERSLLQHDGSTFPAQLTASLLRHDGDPASVLWVVEDISARKAAERETAELMTKLINTERLAAGGRMANTLAHEINNPLEALTNIFYLLGTHEDLPPESREMVAIASREIERVGYITRSALSFYRKAPGRTIDLYSMLGEVMQLFQSRARQYHVELRAEYDEDLREVGYDPALRQVFANLVGNSLEAMEASGGTLTVRARKLDGWTSVLVSDSGHGIERSNLKTIFEPFFTTKGERGTGLGLWVTRGIVEEHGGTLRLRTRTTEPGRGTSIRVRLPVLATDDGRAKG